MDTLHKIRADFVQDSELWIAESALVKLKPAGIEIQKYKRGTDLNLRMWGEQTPPNTTVPVRTCRVVTNLTGECVPSPPITDEAVTLQQHNTIEYNREMLKMLIMAFKQEDPSIALTLE